MLRREVKYLHKQWHAARRDPSSRAVADEIDSLRAQIAACEAREVEARRTEERSGARFRMVVRELGSARAQLSAQQARIARRSRAQTEVQRPALQHCTAPVDIAYAADTPARWSAG